MKILYRFLHNININVSTYIIFNIYINIRNIPLKQLIVYKYDLYNTKKAFKISHTLYNYNNKYY